MRCFQNFRTPQNLSFNFGMHFCVRIGDLVVDLNELFPRLDSPRGSFSGSMLVFQGVICVFLFSVSLSPPFNGAAFCRMK